MTVAADIVLYFGTNADTMIATKALKDAGIVTRMIPRPQGVASQSNLCLSVAGEAEGSAKTALANAGVALGGIVR
jgi:hypothetical protein